MPTPALTTTKTKFYRKGIPFQLPTSYQDEKPVPDEGAIIKSDQRLEAQAPPNETQSTSLGKQSAYLALYMLLSLGLTLANKGVMQQGNFPWLLTCAHSVTTSFGCAVLQRVRRSRSTSLKSWDQLVLVALSILFTLNIAVSNISLSQVSVPFHQVVRATTPVITVLAYVLIYGRKYPRQTFLSMIPLSAGVGLATFGDYYFSPSGFLLTWLGVFLATVKGIATNRVMTGSLKLSPFELVYRMSSMAAVQCLACAYLNGELAEFQYAVATGEQDWLGPFVVAVTVNSTMAFALNIVSFETNRMAGAVAISVCGNVKQCLTIIMGIAMFSVHVSALNVWGMVLVTSGAAWYSKAELDGKRKAQILRSGSVNDQKTDASTLRIR